MKNFRSLSLTLTTIALLLYSIRGHEHGDEHDHEYDLDHDDQPFSHTCIHDELEPEFDLGMHEEAHTIRGRALAEWEPIRIKADYSRKK